MTACLWCHAEFEPKPSKKFCCPAHKNEFHAAARQWTEGLVEGGYLPVEALHRLREPCTAKQG